MFLKSSVDIQYILYYFILNFLIYFNVLTIFHFKINLPLFTNFTKIPIARIHIRSLILANGGGPRSLFQLFQQYFLESQTGWEIGFSLLLLNFQYRSVEVPCSFTVTENGSNLRSERERCEAQSNCVRDNSRSRMHALPSRAPPAHPQHNTLKGLSRFGRRVEAALCIH